MLRRLALACLVLAAGCSDAVGPAHDLSDAHQHWLRTRPTDYRFTLTVSCECLAPGPVVIEVRGEAIISVRVQATGQPVSQYVGPSFQSVDGLFAVIGRAMAGHAAQVDVRYDRQLGYPTRIAIDYEASAVDDEVTYVVAGLEPL